MNGVGTDAADPAVRLRPPAHRVSPRAKTMWRVTSAIGPAAALVGVIGWALLDPHHGAWQAAAAAAIILIALPLLVVIPEWRYRVHRWEADEVAVHSQSGWLTQERRIAPISRVQTVDTHYGPIERMFGLGTVTVTTASASGAVKITGLERAVVDELAARLTRATAKTAGDAT